MPFHQGLLDGLREAAGAAGSIVGTVLRTGLDIVRQDPIGAATAVSILTGRSAQPFPAVAFETPGRSQPPLALPTGGPMPFQQPAVALPPGIIGGLIGSVPGIAAELFGGGGGGGAVMAGGLFRPRAAGVTPSRVVVVPHPVTGEPVFFGHLGRPLLFSRDLSAVRKVNRLARRARRATSKR